MSGKAWTKIVAKMGSGVQGKRFRKDENATGYFVKGDKGEGGGSGVSTTEECGTMNRKGSAWFIYYSGRIRMYIFSISHTYSAVTRLSGVVGYPVSASNAER